MSDMLEGRVSGEGTDIRAIWDGALDIVKGELNTPTFKTWFEHAEPLALDGGQMVVGASNKWGRDWLESRYTGLLATSLSRAAGCPMSVRFVVRDTEEPRAGETGAVAAPDAPRPEAVIQNLDAV